MTEKDEEILADLLLRWEELRERGQDTPASELCREHSHLIEELARRIHALKVTSWLDRPITGEEAPASFPSPTGEPRTLIGRYRLDNLIAEGGFAQVWRGYDLELQRVVAVRVPKPSRLQSTDAFMAEARRVARLKHPGIVPVFDVGREGEVCFIVSEFVEGGSLGDHLVNSPPSQPQAIRWIIEIAEALEYAHLHGVIHRDIKPANILIDHHNRALLADFGIAQSANKAGQQALSLGTLRYMSPEQLEGKTVDPRADIFSLGVVLHEALTGKLPYSSAEPNVLRREIVAGVKNVSASDMPAELRRICQKALQHDPQQRHTSAAHFAADLRRWLSPEKPRPGKRILVGGAVLLVVAALVLAAWWNWRGPQNSATPKADPAELEEALARGKQSFDGKKYPDAIAAYSQAIELDPACAEAYHRRGASLFNTGKLQDALLDFDKAVELDSKNGELSRHRSLALSQLRQYDKAIADLEEAVRLNPADQHECKKLLGINWLYKSLEHQKNLRWKEAIADLDVAIKWEAAAVHFHQRGSCYLNLKEHEKAVADFTEAIKREPEVARHFEKRALAYQGLGKQKEAGEDVLKARSVEAVAKGSPRLTCLFTITEEKAAGKLRLPVGVTFDAAGVMYVADSNNGRIVLFDKEGRFLQAFGKEGLAEGDLHYPHYLAVTNTGAIIVTEHGNHRVSLFDKDGRFLKSFGGSGDGPGKFKNPAGITLGRDGNILVVDQGNHRVQVFDGEGKFVQAVGTVGSGSGKFRHPEGIAVDQEGNWFVADTGNRRIQVFSQKGEFLRMFGTLPSTIGSEGPSAPGMEPHGVAVDDKGKVFISDSLHRSVQVFDTKGKCLVVHCLVSEPTNLFHPLGIAIDGSGRVAVVNYPRHQIRVFRFEP